MAYLGPMAGMNATFSDPINIASIKSFFGSGINDLKGTFYISGVNMAGFNDMDAPTGPTYNMGEWQRYDHHRGSYEGGDITVNQTNIDWFANPFDFTVNVMNNWLGRAYTFQYDVFLNIGLNKTEITTATWIIATNRNGSCNAGTSYGGNGLGSFSFSLSKLETYTDGKGLTHQLQPDTAYTVIVVPHDFSLYSYTYQGNARLNDVKTWDSFNFKSFTLGHIATPANIYASTTISSIVVWKATLNEGAIFPLTITNDGETAGTKTIYCEIRDHQTTPQAYSQNSVTVTVPGKTRGGANGVVNTSCNAGLVRSKFAVGQTVYCFISYDNVNWTYVGPKTVASTGPQY